MIPGTKEKELMDYLILNVFDPIDMSSAPSKVKAGARITRARMSRLNARKMIEYFWHALSQENAIVFSKQLANENLPRFEDVLEEFRDKFNERWLRS